MPSFVDITPDVSLLPKIGQAGHTVAEAVSELVDNSIDARHDGRPIHVDVRYDARGKWIEVIDDGCGMSKAELAHALVLGLSAKSAERIGRFGLGMKSACTSLGNRFEIRTRREENHFEAIAKYDEASFVVGGRWQLPIERRKKREVSGTHVHVESPRVYHGLSQSLIRNLGWTFRHFIADGVLILRINGELVQPPQHQIDRESLLLLSGEVAGRTVRGWAALLVTSSQRGWYGFDLIRHRRVIRRHQKIGFQGHPQTARVVGELHLDDFETNNLKTDFIRETEPWRELEAWLAESIEPVVAASRALAHAGSFDRRLRELIAQERENVLSALGDDAMSDVLDVKPPTRSRSWSSDAVAFVIGPFHVEHVFRHEPAASYMHRDRLERPGEADLIRVVTNLAYAEAKGDPSAWAGHNVAEALALELGSLDDYIETKSRIWDSLSRSPEIARALRVSARASTAAPAAAG